MAQCVKLLATKSDDLNSIPRTSHMNMCVAHVGKPKDNLQESLFLAL